MGAALHSMASPDLLWALTRKHNAFLIKRDGLQLTSEPNNLMNKNCFKYSGLANAEVVGVEECPRGITLKKKNAKNASKPARSVVSTDLKKDFRKVAKSIAKRTDDSFYRRDLKKAAQARWYKIWKSQQKAADSS